jgi:uncharacterized protein YjiS (DUF1127 family)
MAVRVIPTVVPPAAAPRRPGVTELLIRVLFWRDTARQRGDLRRLDDRMLRDIGLSRADVEREAMRPFWDLPTHLRG